MTGVFYDIASKYLGRDWLKFHFVIVPANKKQQEISNCVFQTFPGLFQTYLRADSEMSKGFSVELITIAVNLFEPLTSGS